MSAQRPLVLLMTLFCFAQAKPFFFGSTTTPPTTTEKEPKHTYHIIQIPLLTLPAPFGYHAQPAPIGYRAQPAPIRYHAQPAPIGYHAHPAPGYQTVPTNSWGGWENSLNMEEEGWDQTNDWEDYFDGKDVEHHYHTYDTTGGNTILSPVGYGAYPASGFVWPAALGRYDSGHASPNNLVQNQGVYKINSVGLPQYYQVQPHTVIHSDGLPQYHQEKPHTLILPTPSQEDQGPEMPAQTNNDFFGGIRGIVTDLVNGVASASRLPQLGTPHR